MPQKFTRLEPSWAYDQAIHKTLKSGQLVYDYEKLIQVTQELHQFTLDDAIDWVEFNICGMSSQATFLIHNDREDDNN